GPDWAEQLEREVFDDLMLPLPQVIISQGPAAPSINARVQAVTEKLIDYDRRLQAEIDTIFARDREPLSRLIGSDAPRRPRVLLITTLFSTVLQHSTRDAAQGFT